MLFTSQQKLKNYLKNELVKENFKITIAQTGIFVLPKQNKGLNMAELSQILSIDNSKITGLVDRLEEAGFVKRNVDPNDRRVSQIYITPGGIDEIN